MLKSKRLTDYCFPYAILVSKLIEYFGIDTSNERNETIKAVSEIDNSTLTKMGFHKVEDNWVFLKGKNPQEEHKASNLNNEDGDEVVLMEGDPASPRQRYSSSGSALYHASFRPSHLDSPQEPAKDRVAPLRSIALRRSSQ